MITAISNVSMIREGDVAAVCCTDPFLFAEITVVGTLVARVTIVVCTVLVVELDVLTVLVLLEGTLGTWYTTRSMLCSAGRYDTSCSSTK